MSARKLPSCPTTALFMGENFHGRFYIIIIHTTAILAVGEDYLGESNMINRKNRRLLHVKWILSDGDRWA